MQLSRKQAGFTLIEIAIVLVIIGLLLGGVLKGQELINSAKVKNFAQDFKSVPLFLYGYQDKYRALPGDDPNVATHLSSEVTAQGAGYSLLTVTVGTRGNGTLNGLYNSEAATDESLAFWQQVRLAGLAAGPIDFSNATAIAASVPRNADGGRIGIQSSVPITGLAGAFFICSDGIQGKFAKQLDTMMDDGNTATGSMRVAADLATPTPIATTSIADSTTYLVCMGM